jgi:hypothetical protein
VTATTSKLVYALLRQLDAGRRCGADGGHRGEDRQFMVGLENMKSSPKAERFRRRQRVAAVGRQAQRLRDAKRF